MTELEGVIPLLPSQKAQAAQVLGKAFLTDPAYTAIFPDGEERAQALPSLFGAVVGYSLVYGEVHTTPEVEGVACWLSPGKTQVTLWRNLRTGLGLYRAVGRFNPQARRGFLAVLDYLDGLHKRATPGPHWYLWAVGVEPGRQGRGIGSRLIEPVLNRADEGGLPCYLETQTERNVRFYLKRGFEVVSDSVVTDQGIRIWTMLRDAHR